MALNTEAYEQRLATIEELLNTLQTVVNNLAGKQQLSQLTLIIQKELDALTRRVSALESQLKVLQSSLG